MKIGASRPKKVTTLSGQDPQLAIEHGWLSMKLQVLNEREGVMLDSQ